MALPDPQQIRADLQAVMEELQDSSRPVQQSDRLRMAEKLGTAFNYVAAQAKKPGLMNVLYAQSAHDAKVQEQLAIERRELDKHKAFVELNFESAEKHFKTVQLAGYAVFFAVWGFTRQWIPPAAEALAALLMIVSATVFVVWELGKASTLAAILRKHADVSSRGIDHFLVTRSASFSSTSKAISFFSMARVWAWGLCVVPAICAVGVMVTSIIIHLVAHA